MQQTETEYLTATETAKELDVSESLIRLYIREGTLIPVITTKGGRVLFTSDQVRTLKEQRVGGRLPRRTKQTANAT